MLGKFKEKLKGWFRKSEDKAEKEVEQDLEREIKIEKTVKEIEKKSIEGKSKKQSIIKRLKKRLKFKITEEYFEEIFSNLELLLLENNVAYSVIEKIKSDLKQELMGLEIKKEEVEAKIKEALKISLESLFPESQLDIVNEIKNKKEPYVILFFGINGSGKTTTIAKLANFLLENNISCILAASDTFRAASIEQLEMHGQRLGIRVIKSQYKADPASVAYDAIQHAKSHKINAVLIDTAGRMYTKQDLMKEMEKICRVSNPDLKIFVAESITGNDAIQQAQAFNDTVGIDAIILTKADVDERGGAMISVSYVTGKPILYLGTGQDYEDLEKFEKDKILKSLGFK